MRKNVIQVGMCGACKGLSDYSISTAWSLIKLETQFGSATKVKKSGLPVLKNRYKSLEIVQILFNLLGSFTEDV